MQSVEKRPEQVATGEAATAKQRVFALLRYFSIASFFAIVVATAILTVLQQRLAVRDLIRAQEQSHIVLTQSVAHGHWEEFAEFFRTAATLDVVTIRQHPDYVRLLKQMELEFTETAVLKIKVYDRSGRTIFSTDPKQLGEDKSKNGGFLSALGNVPISELTHRNQFSAFEQTIENIDVVSSYVPVHRGNNREIEAVFEIYSDISPLLQQVNETRNTVAFQVTAALLGLYLVLFFIVRHADGVIKAQKLQHLRDGEKLRLARDEATRSEQFHRALIEHSSDAVVVLDANLKVRYGTSTDARVLGLSENGLIGLSLSTYACEEYRDMLSDWLKLVAGDPEGVHRSEFEGNHAARGRRHFIATATNLCSHPEVGGIVVNIRDDTERNAAELQVRRHALYDELTGLARRDFFILQLRKALAHATRHAEVIAVMFLDLDGFKKINDTLGHDAGDTLLREVAARLRSVLRLEDTMGRGLTSGSDGDIARFGGDEFTLLLTRLGSSENAAMVARRLLDAVKAPYRLGATEVTVTISIGIAMFPRDGNNTDELLKSADAAMYAAKHQGSNSYCFHSAA